MIGPVAPVQLKEFSVEGPPSSQHSNSHSSKKKGQHVPIPRIHDGAVNFPFLSPFMLLVPVN